MADDVTDVRIWQVEVGLIGNFSSIIGCPRTGLCALIDPAFEVDRLYRLLAQHGYRVGAILLTHTHPDHIDGVPEALLRSGGQTPIYVGAAEAEVVAAQCQDGQDPPAPVPLAGLVGLAGGERIALGDLRIEALATPGHTAAGTSYYVPQAGAVFTGDTLFVGSCGATRFAGSDPAALYRSLQSLAALPEETRVYPGHDYGPTRTSTISWELRHNPCFRFGSQEDFVRSRR